MSEVMAATAGFLCALATSFIFVATKAFQSLNVMRGHYTPVIPVSMLMAFVEVFVVSTFVREGLWTFVPLGLGGGSGCIFSMWLHQRMFRRYH